VSLVPRRGRLAVQPRGSSGALAEDAAFALGDVGGPPGGVEVVQCDGAVGKGADAHLLGRADQDGDVVGAAGGEQAGQASVARAS
jgi:hypothetical protein